MEGACILEGLGRLGTCGARGGSEALPADVNVVGLEVMEVSEHVRSRMMPCVCVISRNANLQVRRQV